MRREAEVNRAVDQYGDTIQRICMIHLKNHADTQDIFQEVFLKYALSTAVFEDERQEKAWLIRVAVNACRDLLKSFFRSRVLSVDEALMEQAAKTALRPVKVPAAKVRETATAIDTVRSSRLMVSPAHDP